MWMVRRPEVFSLIKKPQPPAPLSDLNHFSGPEPVDRRRGHVPVMNDPATQY